MITDSYDVKTKALFSPRDFYGEQRHLCDICIVTFSQKILEAMLMQFKCEKITTIRDVSGGIPVYGFSYHGRTVAFFMSYVGATLAGSTIIEANWLIGATTFIMFGSAGSLDEKATSGRYVIPTECYRDEGMSYHYAAPSDYITVREAQKLEEIFTELKLPYVAGRVWTTDAFHRETQGQLQARRSEGCLAVEMELAGIQAVCDFHGFRLFDFLVTGDVLNDDAYSVGSLNSANHDLDKMHIALEIARRV